MTDFSVEYAGQPSPNRQLTLDLFRIGDIVYGFGFYIHRGALSDYVFPDFRIPDRLIPNEKVIIRGFLNQGSYMSGIIFNINTDGTVSTTGTPSYDTGRIITISTVYKV